MMGPQQVISTPQQWMVISTVRQGISDFGCIDLDWMCPPGYAGYITLSVTAAIRSEENPMISISPISLEQEIKLGQKIQEAQAEGTAALLSEEKTEKQLVAVAENAAGCAEAATKKHLHPASPPVACQSSCSWCCYQLVPVSVPEIARIATYLRNLPCEESASITTRLQVLDKATRGITAQQRVRVPKACAYLQDDQCVIHPVRPLACAEFTSYDVQVCKKGKRIGFKPNSVFHEKARMLAYYAVQRGIYQGLQEAVPKADCEALELTAASVVALESPNAFTSWLEGGQVFYAARMRHGKK